MHGGGGGGGGETGVCIIEKEGRGEWATQRTAVVADQHDGWVLGGAEGHVRELGPPHDLLHAEGLVPDAFVCACVRVCLEM